MADQADIAGDVGKQPLVNNKLFSDVTFTVGRNNVPIYGHRFPLALVSDVFFRMFSSDLTPSSWANRITVPDIEPEEFLEMLNHIYYGRPTITVDNVVKLFYAAEKYNLGEMKRQCTEFVSRQENSVLGIFAANMEFSFSELNEACLNVISENPLKFFKSSEFSELPLELVSMIAGQSKLRCNHDQLLEAVKNWTELHKDEINAVQAFKDLKVIVDRKQEFMTYNFCSKIMMIGTHNYGYGVRYLETALKFTPLKPIDIHGIGIYIGTNGESDDVVSVTFIGSITADGETLVKMNVPQVLAIKNNTYVYDCMFERCSLQANTEVQLVCTTTVSSGNVFFLTHPQCIDNNNLISIQFDNNTMGTNIAHIMYRTETK